MLQPSYNHGFNVVVTAGDGLEVPVLEVPNLRLRAIYRLDSNFELESVAMSDAYWETHRTLEREGRIRHSAGECPDRHSKEVLDWSRDDRWKKVVISDPATPR